MARLVAAALAALLAACAPSFTELPWTNEPQGFSVVTLAESKADQYALSPRWNIYCNAFAVLRDGETLLVTAEHCLHDKGLGDSVAYIPPSGWGLSHAEVVMLSEGMDQALLRPEEPGELIPLAVVPPPAGAAAAVSVSSYFGARSAGLVTADLGFGWRATSITIRRGWSGSPVLDSNGAAWGIMSGCALRLGTTDCRNGYSKVAPIP
jgi:hypothetical protein